MENNKVPTVDITDEPIDCISAYLKKMINLDNAYYRCALRTMFDKDGDRYIILSLIIPKMEPRLGEWIAIDSTKQVSNLYNHPEFEIINLGM